MVANRRQALLLVRFTHTTVGPSLGIKRWSHKTVCVSRKIAVLCEAKVKNCSGTKSTEARWCSRASVFNPLILLAGVPHSPKNRSFRTEFAQRGILLRSQHRFSPHFTTAVTPNSTPHSPPSLTPPATPPQISSHSRSAPSFAAPPHPAGQTCCAREYPHSPENSCSHP